MDGSGTVNGIIDFGGGTAAAAGTTMNQNDTITGTSAISGDLLKVSLQNAGGAIGAGTPATPQVNKITVPTVTADVQQSNTYIFDTGGTGSKTQTYTYGSSNGAYVTSTVAATNAETFTSSLNSVAGSVVAFQGGTATVADVSTGTTVTVNSNVTAAVKVGMIATAANSYSSVITKVELVSTTTVITLAKTITQATGTTLTYGGGTVGVTVLAPVAGTVSPALTFGPDADPDTGDSSVPTSSLTVANVAGNQGDLVTFTYNGLTGSYAIGADNDTTASNLKDALTATIPTAQAVAALVNSGSADYVNLTSTVAGVPLANLTFSAAAGNVPTTTTTTANKTAVGGISFGNNSGLDALYVNNISGNAATIDQASVAGATQLWADRSTGQVTFTGVEKTTTIGINGNGTATVLGAVTANFVVETTAANLAVNGGANGGAVTIAEADSNLKTVNISSTAGAQTSTAGQVNTLDGITLNAATTALNINATTSLVTGAVGTGAALATINASGAATSVDLGLLLGTVKTVNASGMTAGGLKATLATTAPTDFSFTGGSGNDEVTVTGAFANTITGINGGGGTADKIIITSLALTSATGSKFSNFEVLENRVAGTQDASVVSGITSVITSTGSGAGFSKLSATQAANVTVRNTAGNATFSLLDATGTSDTLSLTLQNSTAAAVATAINPGNLTVNGIETLNVAVNAGATSIYASGSSGTNARTIGVSKIAFASSGAANLTAITVTGARAIDATLTQVAKLASFNASANTGGVIVVTGPTSSGTNTTDLTVTGSSTAANKFTLGVMGTGGTQTIVGGTSTDYIVGTQDIIALATISGGLGIDTLAISDNVTSSPYTVIADDTFDNVTGIEKFALSLTTGTLSWVAGTNVNALVAASGGVWDVTATAITNGALTLDASTLSAGSSLKATIATVGASSAGAVIVFSSSTGADSIKISATGTATGSITVDARGNSTGVSIDLSGSTGALAGSQTSTLTGGSGADTIVGGAFIDTITGGAGRDVITGGTGADKFVYTTAASSIGKVNVDRITDFASASDAINLKDGIFGAASANAITTSSVGSTTTTAVDNTVSSATVNTIDDVYAAIQSNTAFSASNFGASVKVSSNAYITFIAETITFASGNAQGSYLVVNNGVAGFQADGDFVVQISTIGLPTIIGNDIVGIA